MIDLNMMQKFFFASIIFSTVLIKARISIRKVSSIMIDQMLISFKLFGAIIKRAFIRSHWNLNRISKFNSYMGNYVLFKKIFL